MSFLVKIGTKSPIFLSMVQQQHYISGVVKLEGRLLLFLDISRIATDVHAAIEETEVVSA